MKKADNPNTPYSLKSWSYTEAGLFIMEWSPSVLLKKYKYKSRWFARKALLIYLYFSGYAPATSIPDVLKASLDEKFPMPKPVIIFAGCCLK